MEVEGTHTAGSLDEMDKIAKSFVKEVKQGDVLALQGELGSGKTTFTQFLSQSLGVRDTVTSPTFTIMSEYEVDEHKDIDWFIHIDLYRLDDTHGVDKEYIDEIIKTADDKHRLVVIEWPERLSGVLVQANWKLKFEHGKTENMRLVKISHK